MKKPMPTFSHKAFPVKSVTLDTFDLQLNGLNEHSLSFSKAIPLILDDPKRTYADLLKDFARYLIVEEHIKIDEGTKMYHIKTNVYKKVSISCMVDLRTHSEILVKKTEVEDETNGCTESGQGEMGRNIESKL